MIWMGVGVVLTAFMMATRPQALEAATKGFGGEVIEEPTTP